MYTEKDLVDFGNYLFRAYDVQQYSNDGKNQLIRQRQVSDADICNWGNRLQEGNKYFPCSFDIGDDAWFCCMPNFEISSSEPSSLPGVPCEVLAIHFYEGKVKFDLDLIFIGGHRSRIYNVDSILVYPVPPAGNPD